MTSKMLTRDFVDKDRPGDGARVLLVNKDSRDLVHYVAVLQKVGCQVRTSLSFTEGAQFLERERYDFIVLDQGSRRFEGREVLMSAMEVDSEVPVLVLARSYDRACYEEAMQAGALDYVEGPLSEVEIVALLETFTPRQAGSRAISTSRVKSATPGKKAKIKAEFRGIDLETRAAGDSREQFQL